jgi:membrane-bound metal-dependent hydrolase YbcI (DUF457 family)
MDTITHGIVGALAGKALLARRLPKNVAAGDSESTNTVPLSRTAILACTIGSVFPDIDIFAGSIARNPLAIMEWHRNISHSLIMLPLWALMLTVVSVPFAKWLRWGNPSFAYLTVAYAVGLASHVFLDLVTNFGTMIWSPLSFARVAWDWLFILDLTLTGLALVPQLAAWCYRDLRGFAWRATAVWLLVSAGAYGGFMLAESSGYPFSIWVVVIVSLVVAAVLGLPAIKNAGFSWGRAWWCRAGLVFIAAYLALACAAHRKALAQVEEFAASQHLQVKTLAALPLPPTLTHWAGVISTPEGVWRTTFHVPAGEIERTQLYLDAGSNRYVQRAKQLRDVQVYLWFARFPIWQLRRDAGRTIVEISDVRFFRDDNSGVPTDPQQPKSFSGIRSNRSGFTFQVVFDSSGQVVSSGFKKPQS